MQEVETLIIGAGVIGSSLAMSLAELGMGGIRVIDFDLEGSFSSSELNAGGVRATWAEPINIQMSKLSIEYFAAHATEVGYRPCGYLWLHSPERLPGALKARERQVAAGWPVETWDLPELRKRVPFLDKTEGVAAAFFAPRDGLVNPNLLKKHFRQKAREKGVIFDDRTFLQQVEYARDGSSAILATARRWESVLPETLKQEILVAGEKESSGLVKYRARRIVNCAGPWACRVASILGYTTPSVPLRRQVCIFDCRDVDLTPYGMIVDTSGVYFHPEATNGLAGFASHGEKPGFNFSYDGESFFMDVIWPALYERSTVFERLKHVTGWAGLYEVSPDESAILGPVKSNVFEAHSFSGHGVMQSYAAGLLLAERIMTGKYQTLDGEVFSGHRFETGQFVRESLVI